MKLPSWLRRNTPGSLADTPGNRINEAPVDLNRYNPGTEEADLIGEQPAVTSDHLSRDDVAVADPEAKIDVAPQWKLIWWRFRKSPLAIIGLAMVIAIYLVALFASFLAPFETSEFTPTYTYAPPQRIHLLKDGWDFDPHVLGYSVEINQESLSREFAIDPSQQIDVEFFVSGHEYNLFGFIPMDIHLIGPAESTEPMYLLGADQNGRDVFSRLIYGTRISMTVGLIGVALSLVLECCWAGSPVITRAAST